MTTEERLVLEREARLAAERKFLRLVHELNHVAIHNIHELIHEYSLEHIIQRRCYAIEHRVRVELGLAILRARKA